MMWLGKILRAGKSGNARGVLKEAEVERAKQELNILHFNFKDALKFLKQKHKRHYQLPLYMLVGHSSFGKTTLLANSGVQLADIYGNPIRAYTSTKYCSWWFSDQAVYLDTAGVYSKTDKDDPHYNLVWMGFLKLLKNYFFNEPISGIIVVVDVPHLAGEKDELQRILNDIKERIYEVARYVKRLPIYVVFTKADLICGFQDFFANLTLQEKAETLGFNLPLNAQSSNQMQIFHDKYDELMRTLYNRVVPRLREEKDEQLRQKIIDFPQQMELLRERIIEVINIIPNGAHIQLAGMYFTSSVQHGNAVNLFDTKLTNAYGIQPLQTANLAEQDDDEASAQSAYFVTNLFRDIISAERRSCARTFTLSPRKIAYVAGAVVVIGASFVLWQMAYDKSIGVANSVKGALQNYNSTHNLDALGMFILDLQEMHDAWWTSVGLSQTRDLERALRRIYTDAVLPILMPQLQKALETVITVSGSSEPEEVYAALRVYQMLGGQQKFDATYIQNWFDKYWDRTVNAAAFRRNLKNQLAVVVRQGIKIDVKPQIVTVAKDSLDAHGMPNDAAIYANLERRYAGQDVVLKGDASQHIAISQMYTAANVRKIYGKEIREVVMQQLSKNKNLGISEREKQQFVDESVAKLTESMKAMYLRKYAETWNVALQSVKLPEAHNIGEASRILSEIANADLPLLPLIKMVQINTLVDTAPAEFTQRVTTGFTEVNAIDLKLLYANITNMANYLSNIANSANPNKAAFTAAAMRFQSNNSQNDALSVLRQLALRQPQPVQSWLQQLADNSWKAILSSAHEYINSVWISSVMPQYQKSIVDRYPFYKTSKQSVAIDDFILFFGPNGAIDNFFNSYLKPFVDTTQVYWVWKEFDGQHIDIEQSVLEGFIRAALIQKMFFANLTSSMNVGFALVPLAMSPHTQTFSLNFGGQFVSYRQSGVKQPIHLVWPPQGVKQISFEFTSEQGKKAASVVDSDAWAWFRLLDKYGLHSVGDSQHFEMLFDLNGNSVRYALVADQPVNPFISEIIDNFRCPEKL